MPQRLLGRPYRIAGRVVHGQKLGRQLGIPDGEHPAQAQPAAAAGVFAVTVDGGSMRRRCRGWRTWAFGRRWRAMARAHLEVHLFDFDGDLYRAHLR